MQKLKTYIIGIVTPFILFMSNVSASSNKDVKLTTPIGSDILPGGKILGATDVKSSFIFSTFIPFLIKYSIRLAVALSVIALIVGGYQYMTAYGDEEKYKNAQKTITYAIIGLILAITAFGIVKIITNIKIV